MTKTISSTALMATLFLAAFAHAGTDASLAGSMASAAGLFEGDACSLPSEAEALLQASSASSCAAAAAPARSSIEAATARLRSAFASGDASELAAIFTEGANVFVPGNVSLQGRADIVRYIRGQHSRGLAKPMLRTEEVMVLGDLAYESGTYGFEGGAAGSHLSGDHGRYFAIWKADADGTWHYQAGIWNSDRAASASHSRSL